MKLALLSSIVFLLAMLGMAAGVLLGRGPLRGTCGGPSCDACDRKACHREHPP